MIRVLLVDDSPVALHVLQRLLATASDIEVVGTAPDGKSALDLLSGLDINVICTDLHMPGMGGLEFIRNVLTVKPIPILVVSVSVEASSENVFRALEAGAVDVLLKPRDLLGADQGAMAKALASKIRVVAGVHVFRHKRTASVTPSPPPPPLPEHTPIRMVTIGASTGGPLALYTILARLPKHFPVPVACVQHIGGEFLSDLVAWLGEVCPLPVRIAGAGETPRGGVVYFAPDDTHLEFDSLGRFALSVAPPLEGHRPSATVTMRSAARHFAGATVGVLLSGMGRDGADGMLAISQAGGVTFAQNEATCVVYGMPKEAVALGAAQFVLGMEQIAPALASLLQKHNGAGTAAQGKAQ